MEEKKRYALPIPRGITTGIVFEAVEKFHLELDQEEPPEDAFDSKTDMPTKDFVPRMILWGDSPATLMEAKEYIYKRHVEWITNVDEWRKMRIAQIMKKVRKR
ncbi:MAG: hypothetical protein WAV32_01190 [Halobacteriota archaeon]